MPITVRGLLEMPHLSLATVAGAAGLDREVGWVHVAEVQDPTPWLDGGELILTSGMALTADASEQAVYLRRLVRARVSGLVVVSDTAPALSAQIRAVADEHALPLLTTELKQPFQAIAKLVYAANSSVQAELLMEHLRIYGVLRSAAADGIGGPELVDRLSAISRVRLAVVRDDGRPQFGTGDPHPRWPEAVAALEALSRGARQGMYARLQGAGGNAGYVLQLSAPTSSRVFLLAEAMETNPMPDLVALHHIATVLASQVMAQRSARAIRQRVGAELLRELVDGDVGRSVPARLRGLDMPTQPLVALCVRTTDGEPDVSVERLHDGLLDHDRPALVAKRRGEIIVVVAATEPPIEVAQSVRGLAVEAFESACAVSAGTPGDPGHLRTSFQQAVVAIEHARLAPDKVAAFSRLDAPLTWMPADPAATQLLVEQTIGPLLAYDREHRADLLLTLNVYLRAAATAEAAHALHVHRNTLAYRLKRIERITSRSLASMDDRFELWLGLRAYELRGAALD